MKLDDIPQDIEPQVGDILEIEQGDVCFEVRIIGITAERPVADKSVLQVGGKVEACSRGGAGVEVLDFRFGECAVVDGDVVEGAV